MLWRKCCCPGFALRFRALPACLLAPGLHLSARTQNPNGLLLSSPSPPSFCWLALLLVVRAQVQEMFQHGYDSYMVCISRQSWIDQSEGECGVAFAEFVFVFFAQCFDARVIDVHACSVLLVCGAEVCLSCGRAHAPVMSGASARCNEKQRGH